MADSQEFQRPLNANNNPPEPGGFSPFGHPEQAFPNSPLASSFSQFPKPNNAAPNFGDPLFQNGPAGGNSLPGQLPDSSSFGNSLPGQLPDISSFGNAPAISSPDQQSSSSSEVIPTLLPGKAANQNDSTSYPSSSPVRQLFDRNKDSIVQIWGPSKTNPQSQILLGSGFFIDNRGDLATAYHVVKDLTKINVIDSKNVQYQGNIVSSLPAEDVAVVSIGPGVKTKPAQLAANGDGLRSGESLTAIGHPQGWQNTYVSPGKYTGLTTESDISGGGSSSDTANGRPNGPNPQQNLVQADINIQGGSSGSPVFDASGKVVGIVDLGDQGHQGDFASVNDLWPLLPKPVDQTTKPKLPGDIPYKLHFSGQTFTLGATSGALALSLKYPGIAPITGLVSGITGTSDLFNSDLPFLKTAFSHGSSREKWSALTDVGTDALMIGGAALSFTPWRTAGTILGLTGALIKTGDNLSSYRRYT